MSVDDFKCGSENIALGASKFFNLTGGHQNMTVGLKDFDVSQIKEIEYSYLKTVGNYNNERVSARADTNGKDPVEALRSLREWVHGQLSLVPERNAIQDDIRQLEWTKGDLEGEIEVLTGKLQSLKDVLLKFNVSPEEIPF